jgi:hypothetical protein
MDLITLTLLTLIPLSITLLTLTPLNVPPLTVTHLIRIILTHTWWCFEGHGPHHPNPPNAKPLNCNPNPNLFSLNPPYPDPLDPNNFNLYV